jgi:hypothetical protein
MANDDWMSEIALMREYAKKMLGRSGGLVWCLHLRMRKHTNPAVSEVRINARNEVADKKHEEYFKRACKMCLHMYERTYLRARTALLSVGVSKKAVVYMLQKLFDQNPALDRDIDLALEQALVPTLEERLSFIQPGYPLRDCEYAWYSIHKYQDVTQPTPALSKIIPTFDALGDHLVARYNASYAQTVKDSRSRLEQFHQQRIRVMAAAVAAAMPAGRYWQQLYTTAAAVVPLFVMPGARKTLQASIICRVYKNDASFFTEYYFVDQAGPLTPEQTAKLVDEVVYRVVCTMKSAEANK